MGWLSDTGARRGDPQTLWPEARSVVVLGLNYGGEADPLAAAAEHQRGVVSVYARGRDYHDILKKRLKALARWIAARWPAELKVFVDTAPVMEKLYAYLLELKQQLLPKSPSGAAVRYALNQWQALNVYLDDGELEIDNGATERANRDIAVGRRNWTLFGSDAGGRTAAILRTFIASCKRNAVEPFAWFRDVLSRIGAHPVSRIAELLPHNWKPLASNT
jgi:hypothetical protein